MPVKPISIRETDWVSHINELQYFLDFSNLMVLPLDEIMPHDSLQSWINGQPSSSRRP